jgi:hypothetical protein
MDRRAASEHGGAQRNGARLVVVRVRLFFRGRLRFFGRRRRRFCFGGRGWRGRRSPGRTALRSIGLAFRGRRYGRTNRRGLLGLGLLGLGLLSLSFSGFFSTLVLVSFDDRRVAAEIAPQLLGVVIVDGTRMGQRLSDTELVQFIDDLTRLYLELPRQLIDSNLTHV